MSITEDLNDCTDTGAINMALINMHSQDGKCKIMNKVNETMNTFPNKAFVKHNKNVLPPKTLSKILNSVHNEYVATPNK